MGRSFGRQVEAVKAAKQRDIQSAEAELHWWRSRSKEFLAVFQSRRTDEHVMLPCCHQWATAGRKIVDAPDCRPFYTVYLI